ncbi:MAG: ATP-binding protein [Oligoflexia bacterium]|nr:ATP-binding protein [Oligoflexia bacterium]
MLKQILDNISAWYDMKVFLYTFFVFFVFLTTAMAEEPIEESKKSILVSSEESTKEAPLDRVKEAENKKIKNEEDKLARQFDAIKTDFVKTISEKKTELVELQLELGGLSSGSLKDSSQVISEKFSRIVQIWRVSADHLFILYQDSEALPLAERLSVLFSDEDSADYRQKLEANTKEKNQDLSSLRIKLTNELKAINFRLVSDAGVTRAKFLELCEKTNCQRPRGINQDNIEDLKREFALVPLRLLSGALNKWIEVRAKFNAGVDGWIDLFKQFIALLGLLAVPLILTRTLRWASRQLDEIRKNMLSRSMLDYRRRTQIAMWITRLNPFIPSVGMILAIYFSRKLIENTDLKEISTILYYVGAYFIYRACRLLLAIILDILFSTSAVDSQNIQKIKTEASAARISRLLFIEFVLLHVTEDTVRRAFAYQILSSLVLWVNLFFALSESSKWKQEIITAFRYRFSKLELRLQKIWDKKISIILMPLLLLLITFNDLLNWAIFHLEKIDFVKKILSEVLRKKLERAEKESVDEDYSISDEYLKQFDYYLPANKEIYVKDSESIVDSCSTLVVDWLDKKGQEDLLLIVGNRGMGKTTTLEYLKNQITDKATVFHKKIEDKSLDEDSIFRLLSEVFGTRIQSISDLLDFDERQQKKIVVLLDDIHNLFLGKIHGFNGYKLFLRLLNLRTKNIFWCLTVNSRAWSYLKGVLGKEHFYGETKILKPWSDIDIQKLILKRHNTTDFSRTFDESIKAYGAGDAFGQQTEIQFFRLLWGQSRGNPRSALMYWISAISNPRDKIIHVGVPSFVSSSLVSSMSDESLFILAAIARHESLDQEEISEVTRIEDTIIRKCINESLDKELIWLGKDNRYRVSSRSQYVIDYFLIGKNFLYE